MLYIFHVDTGTTITFDIKLALQTVSQLMEAIERECGVVAAHQVLLMSGGESLEPNARVCSYSAGTDTNPIYLFSKAAIENQIPPMPSIDYGSDIDLQSQIDASLAMPATYQTLVARAQLAQQCCVLAGGQTRICERLVHDQHLQQQGWAAVVANLEDITQMFQSRAAVLQQSFAVYLSERQQHMELLQNFNADLGMLAKIPILRALRAQAEGLLSPEDQPSQSEKDANGQEEVFSLLRWISAKDNQSSLEQVAEQCSRGLEQFDERVMEALKSEVNAAIDSANKQDMKEIKGLGERLFALEQLMQQTKKLVQEQGELAQGFLQNQSRASNLGDASILPDLCISHRRQLLVMLQNHNQLRDIRRRCTKAKEELSVNIYHRLKWIMYVENKMMEVDSKLMMYNESLKRLRRHLEVLQQIHLAPQMYMNAVAEVVRRRTFSQAFLVWASNLACQLLTVHSEELARRREFQSKFDGHFLNTLFPGLEDTPPPFATQAPSVFDGGLPKLTVEDMESLRSQLPDLALTISSPDLNSITQFFLSKSLTDASTDGNKEKDSSSMRVDDEAAKEQKGTRAPMLSDRGDFESETDTEEFEKIGQGATDSKPESFDGAKQMRQKQLEVGASRSVSPSSSTSTNVSPLNSKVVDLTNRSTSSSEPGSFHFPSLPISERPSQLSPLTECAENVESSCLLHRAANGLSQYSEQPASSSTAEEPRSLSPNPSSFNPRSVLCDGQQQQQQRHQLSSSGGSSPSVGVGTADFMGTEFYMDESLPSSLSEHPADGPHQAIISLLQENLGNTREEVERLRSILKTMRAVMSDAMSSVRQELSVLRDQTSEDKGGLREMTERVREALSLYSSECDRRLREREQELTVGHELEMADVKKVIQSREDEICTLKRIVLEKETELSEHERLMTTMRQKLESEQTEMRNLQTRLHQQLEEALEQARMAKEVTAKKANDDRFREIATLTNSVTQCQETIQELEDKLSTARNDQQRMVEATDMLHMEYKDELETIRVQLNDITMERSSNDACFDKLTVPRVLQMAFQILAQVKKDYVAIRTAVEEERAASMEKVDLELKMARQVVEEKEQEVNMYMMREFALLEELEQYKTTIRRVTKSEEFKNVPEEMSVSQMREVLKGLRAEKDEVNVSESKKVRLEANDDQSCLSRRLEMLENDNKRLSSEMQALREYRESTKAKLEALKAEKVRLELELVKERSRRSFVARESSEGHEKEMNASVAVVSEGSSRDAATSPEPQCCMCGYARKKMKKTAEKLVQQRRITVTSCDPGDRVLVFWNPTHENFTLYQESPTFYFLNTDCVAALDLGLNPDGTPKRLQTIAEVVDKEYCQAKKTENTKGLKPATATRLKPWAIQLLESDFEIEYIQTQSFDQADASSPLAEKLDRDNSQELQVATVGAVETDVRQIRNLFIAIFGKILRKKLLSATRADHNLVAVMQAVKSGWKKFGESEVLRHFFKRRNDLSVIDGTLRLGNRVVIPQQLQPEILLSLHNGHLGSRLVKKLAGQYVYWQNMSDDIQRLVEQCGSCALMQSVPVEVPSSPWPTSTMPMELMHVDYAGPFDGQEHILLFVDALSKFIDVGITSTISGFGTPDVLIIKRDSQCTAEQFAKYCEEMRITHIFSVVNHPESSEQIGKIVDAIKVAIARNPSNWRPELFTFLRNYRYTPCTSATSENSPMELSLDQTSTSFSKLLPELKKEATACSDSRKKKDYVETETARHHGARQRDLKVGDRVFVLVAKNKRKRGNVSKVLSEICYAIRLSNGEKIVRHINHIWKDVPNVHPSANTGRQQKDHRQEDHRVHQSEMHHLQNSLIMLPTEQDRRSRLVRNRVPAKRLVMDPDAQPYSRW